MVWLYREHPCRYFCTTGESVPREVTEGSEIISGCVNGSGLLKVRTTKEFDDSTVAKILELVENASRKRHM